MNNAIENGRIINGRKWNVVGFILWLIWVAVVVIILGGVVYLFVGGSTLFANVNTNHIIAYRQISYDKISLTGSVMLPSQCHKLKVHTMGDSKQQEIGFIFDKFCECEPEDNCSPMNETFFTEIDGDEDTEITASIDGYKKEIIIK